MNTKTQTFSFLSQEGGAAEFHVMVTVTDASLGYEEQLAAVLEACAAASEGRSVHFRRFFLSDATNQAPQLLEALRAMPEAPGFAFGLAASALWPGTLAGKRIALTGSVRWIFLLICFLFGLLAILYAASREKRGEAGPIPRK